MTNKINSTIPYSIFTKRVLKMFEEKEYSDTTDMSPRTKNASIERFLSRVGQLLQSDVEITPLECLQRIYVIYDEEVNGR